MQGGTAADSTGTIVLGVAPPMTGTLTASGCTLRKSAKAVFARTQFNSTHPRSVRGLYTLRSLWISATNGTILSTGSVATIVKACNVSKVFFRLIRITLCFNDKLLLFSSINVLISFFFLSFIGVLNIQFSRR